MASRPRGNGTQEDANAGVAEVRSWRLGFLLAFVILLAFLAGTLVRISVSLETWQAQLPVNLTGMLSPGAVSPAHQRFEARCSTCHQAAFTAVGDAACVACHKAVGTHHNKPGMVGTTSPEPPCIACHVAHRNKAAVVDTASTPCLECHAHEEARVAANRDFGTAHALFRLTLSDGKQQTWWREDSATPLREQSGLKFSHAAHLKEGGVSSPEGQTILGCISCHRTDDAGRGFSPPQMEVSCQQSGCHRARFAEPMHGVVPHVPAREVLGRMRTFFAARLADDFSEFRQRCGGAGQATNPGRRLLDCASDIALDAAARSVFKPAGDDPGCALCHDVMETGQRDIPWKIEPVRWNARWHASANFPHARHSTINCGDCHSKRRSKEAADVSIPGIAKCRECHAGMARTQGSLATGCADCHAFHRHAALASPEAR